MCECVLMNDIMQRRRDRRHTGLEQGEGLAAIDVIVLELSMTSKAACKRFLVQEHLDKSGGRFIPQS